MGRVTPSVPALRGATLSIGICSTCKSPKLAEEWAEGIMIYKTGPSLHRERERLRDWGKERENTPFINLLYGPYNSTAFLCIFKSAEEITQKPLLNWWRFKLRSSCSLASWTVLKMCTCVLHEGRRSLPGNSHNGSPTEQLITVNWGGAPGQFWLGNVQYAVKTAPCVRSPLSDLISTCDNTT